MTRGTGNDDLRVVAVINEAINLAEHDEYEPAIRLLMNTVKVVPNSSALRGYLSWYLLQTDRVAEAIDESRIAVDLAPDSERVSMIRFHVLWKAGMLIDALDEMKRFVSSHKSKEYATIIREWSL